MAHASNGNVNGLFETDNEPFSSIRLTIVSGAKLEKAVKSKEPLSFAPNRLVSFFYYLVL